MSGPAEVRIHIRELALDARLGGRRAELARAIEAHVRERLERGGALAGLAGDVSLPGGALRVPVTLAADRVGARVADALAGDLARAVAP